MISLVETLFAYLSLKYDNVKLYKDIDPTFEDDNLELTMDIVLSVSLWRLIRCLFSVGKNIKELNEV